MSGNLVRPRRAARSSMVLKHPWASSSDVLGEQGEQAAHEEVGHELGGVAGLFERPGQLGELAATSRVTFAARRLGSRASGSIQTSLNRSRISFLGQVAQLDPMGTRVGKGM